MNWQLTPDQAHVLKHYQGGHCAVLAAPGAGKTTLISHWIAHWVKHQKITPNRILVLTFTDSAAQEFEKRTRQLLEEPFPVPEFSTIHAFCWRILRRFDAAYTDREVITEDRQYALLDHLVQSQGLEQTGVDYIPLLSNTLIPWWRHQPQRLLNWHAYALHMTPEQQRRWPLLLEVAQLYEAALIQENAVDYDAMITHTLQLLKQAPGALLQLQTHYPYVIEDEAQDSSGVQGELLGLLARGGNWLRVGDPNQSIYGFSGADHRHLHDFAEKHIFYPLGESNRATPALMDLCNVFHRQFEAAFPSPVMLKPGAVNPTEGWIWVHHYPSLIAELQAIAKATQSLLTKNHSVAVLCRTHAGCERISTWLVEQQLPVVHHQERDNNLLLSEVALYLESLLGFLLQPTFHLLQTLSWRSGLSRQSFSCFFSLDQEPGRVLRYLATRQVFHPQVNQAVYEQWVTLAAHLVYLSEHLYYPALWVLETAIERLFSSEIQRIKARLLVHTWHHSHKDRDALVDFQNWLTQVRKRKIRQLLPQEAAAQAFTTTGVIHVLTTHKAKGLEWDGVILPFFSYESRERGTETEWQVLLKALYDKQPIETIKTQLQQAEQDENIRLAYVGLSRAKRYLMVSAAAERQPALGVYRSKPSRTLQCLIENQRIGSRP